ncbi:MAG: hypothetical protein FRX49_07701 [Trebouxia sp. A1-2]|nr:MAG: hypothetical protein FRX49_07701 [Trebouxia sp. A1-2]
MGLGLELLVLAATPLSPQPAGSWPMGCRQSQKTVSLALQAYRTCPTAATQLARLRRQRVECMGTIGQGGAGRAPINALAQLGKTLIIPFTVFCDPHWVLYQLRTEQLPVGCYWVAQPGDLAADHPLIVCGCALIWAAGQAVGDAGAGSARGPPKAIKPSIECPAMFLRALMGRP